RIPCDSPCGSAEHGVHERPHTTRVGRALCRCPYVRHPLGFRGSMCAASGGRHTARGPVPVQSARGVGQDHRGGPPVRPAGPLSAFARKKRDMGLGKKRGHVQGSQVSGGHTTLIDGADAVVKKLGGLPWFESVRPGVISVAKGGKLSVTVRRPV